MKAKASSKSQPTSVKLLRVDEVDERGVKIGNHYKIAEMTHVIVLDDKWRVGDSLTEEESLLLARDVTVTVVS